MRVRIRRFDEGFKSGARVTAGEQFRCWRHRRLLPFETSGAGSRLASRSAPLRYVPVGTMNLWPLQAKRCSLASSFSMAPPSSLFGPSCFDWNSKFSTTASADSCTAQANFRWLVPTFQASLTCWSDDDSQVVYAGLPG
jgi:hypothetical protein